MIQTFYSNGKLLLTGEYVVLDGALSLAIPTQFGQSLKVESINEPKIIWKSIDGNGNIWFEDEFILENGELKQVLFDNEISNKLFQILNTAKQLNPDFLNGNKGFYIESNLSFPREWGLGTSSTLINNIAQWAKVDAYELLELSFGGSGYDIACAQHDTPITYQILNQNQDNKRQVSQVKFDPPFKECIYFVYLNKKQNSKEGIIHYKKNASQISNVISEISRLTLKFIECKQLEEFEKHIYEHETLISNIIKQKTVKDLLFNDYKGSIKSLGAWGGDFVLVTSKADPTDYFKNKGFKTVIPFDKMILN